jgi:hypothetical protein
MVRVYEDSDTVNCHSFSTNKFKVRSFAAEYTHRIVSPAQFYNVHRINEVQYEVLREPLLHSKIAHQPGRQVNV